MDVGTVVLITSIVVSIPWVIFCGLMANALLSRNANLDIQAKIARDKLAKYEMKAEDVYQA